MYYGKIVKFDIANGLGCRVSLFVSGCRNCCPGCFNMDTWNNSEKYPKTVVVIDLNNVKYVNDNYGHEAGDKLITQAASTLLNTQLENSEIIRTDGNEFLIYMVGYSDKQVEIYTKKLTKELKELNYGFGAAIGYSSIKDGMKTIDDAINEATLEMRTNKEDYK